MFYVIMGVSGTGKSTIGKILSERTGWKFIDADDYHPRANLEKLNQGIALNDRDRLPWLQELRRLISQTLSQKQSGILACSALKSQYRQILSGNSNQVKFIYLAGDYDCIQARIQQRQGHFMNPELLRSQFETLEAPKDAIMIDVSLTPEQIIERILRTIDN